MKRTIAAVTLASFVSSSLLPAAVWAQLAGIAARGLPAGTTVQLDKLLADPVWEQAPRFNAFVDRAPVNAGLPSQQTSVQVLFDGRDIYVGVRAEDHRPELIRARLGPHDSVGAEQDSVAVLIDSVGSRKAAQYFRVNPLGATSDGMYTADTDSARRRRQLQTRAVCGVFAAALRAAGGGARSDPRASAGHFESTLADRISRHLLRPAAGCRRPADANTRTGPLSP